MQIRELKFLTVAAVAALGLGLAGCGGGGSSDTTQAPPPVVEPEPTAYEVATAAIAAAETEADARAAVTAAVAAGITGAQLQSLNMAVDERVAAIAAAEAAAQRAAVVAAAMCDAATAECLAAHNALVTALQGDVAELADDEDATNAQQTAAQMALEEAEEDRDAIQTAINDNMRDTDTGMKVTAAENAANGLETARTAADIEAAEEALTAAKEAVGDTGAYADEIAAAEMAIARAKERNTVDAAVMAATAAASGLTEDSDADAVTAAQGLIDAAKMAVANAEHLSDSEKEAHNATITSDERLVTLARNRNDDAADEQRMAEEEEQRKANEARAATAAKLFDGLEHGLGDTDNARTVTSADTGVISVTIGTGAAVPLAEDKKTTVAALHDWEGKRHTAEPTGDAGTYEAIVYSNVGEGTEGEPFNEEYTLVTTATATVLVGEVGIDQSDTTTHPTSRVASPSFDQSAGTKEFKKGDNLERVMISGSYHGVSGTYYCTPADASTCAVRLAVDGFDLGGTLDSTNAFSADGGTWAFKPGTATAKVMGTPDAIYASYGWWLHKSEDGNTYTASAFATSRGAVDAASGITALRGTATYMGGAAGQYALSSSTGGTNDSGDFTARATLEADFNADTITGTIDTFVDGDGASKDWSVELKKSGIGDTGTIAGDGSAGDTDLQNTVWTIGGTAAKAAGQWSGTLYDNGDDGVPKVGTGTFHSTYGQDGRMVGAFGVNKQ